MNYNQVGRLLTSMVVLIGIAALDAEQPARIFSVMDYGATGDGVSSDTAAIQKTIDAAAEVGHGAKVVLLGARRYVVGTLFLRSGIEFHFDRKAELLVSTNHSDYKGDGVLMATGATDLRITGPGKINGRARAFMTGYDKAGEWWVPADWRPKMFILTACTNLEINNLTFGEAPQWGLHMLGCRHVLVERLTIRNLLDVPNCDGVDPDHCQDVEIRNCHITCGDDAIVLKTTRQTVNYGPCANIRVKDCVLETQDSGLKIGTETTEDIHDVSFQHCRIVSSSRGLTIQLRDEGNVYNVDFSDIKFLSRYYADPWWGRGEAISLTALPRTAQSKVGTLHNVCFRNIFGRAENSARVSGIVSNRVHDIRFEKVSLEFGRWTSYPGGVFDNRPTTAMPAIEPHSTPGFSLRYADNVILKNCKVRWMDKLPTYFTHALKAEDVGGLQLTGFQGEAAHPATEEAVFVW
jgi:hypothetical protein